MANRSLQVKHERARQQRIEAGILLQQQYTFAYGATSAKDELITLARNCNVRVTRCHTGEKPAPWGKYTR